MMNDKIVSYKVDTGSDVTVLPKRLFDPGRVAPCCKLYPSSSRLRAFGGGIVKPVGVCQIECKYKNIQKNINIEIVDIETVPLFAWIDQLCCFWFG